MPQRKADQLINSRLGEAKITERDDSVFLLVLGGEGELYKFQRLVAGLPDDEMAAMREVLDYFSQKFEIDSDEREALNRMSALPGLSKQGPGAVRNNVGKIANALRSKGITQLKFF